MYPAVPRPLVRVQDVPPKEFSLLNSPTKHRLPLGGPIVAYYRVPCGFRLSRRIRVAGRTSPFRFTRIRQNNPSRHLLSQCPAALSLSLSGLSFRDNGPCVWESLFGALPSLGNVRCNIFERLYPCEFTRGCFT